MNETKSEERERKKHIENAIQHLKHKKKILNVLAANVWHMRGT